MGNGNTVRDVTWFANLDGEWRDFVGPLMDGILDGDEGSVVGEGGVPNFDDFFVAVATRPDWQEDIRYVNTRYRSLTARTTSDLNKINVLRLMARITPGSQDRLFTNTFRRDGFEVIEVPSLPAILAGFVPSHARGEYAFSRALNLMSKKWYGGDARAMAEETGVNEFVLEAMIRGKHHPKSHGQVVSIANALGVDPYEFDLLWFADKNRKQVAQFLGNVHSKTSVRSRARLLNRIAATRLGFKYRHRTDPRNSIHHYLDLASFGMLAGIHPKTAIPIVAGLGEENEELFSSAMPYAEFLAIRGKPWKAAIVCFLAADHAQSQANIQAVTRLVAQGNYYLLNCGDVLPDYLRPEHAHELRAHYIKRGLELHEIVSQTNSDRVTAQIAYPASVARDLTAYVKGMDSGTVDGDSGFAGVLLSAATFEGRIANMTAGREAVLAEFKSSSPDKWEVIENSGRADIVDRAFALADPNGERSAVSFTLFNAALSRLAENEGVIGEGFGVRVSESKGIGVGDTVTYGGTCFGMTESGLVPMLPIVSPVMLFN